MKITEFLELSEQERDAFVAREVMGWHEWDFVYDYDGEYPMFRVDDYGILVYYSNDDGYPNTCNLTTTWEGMRLVVEKMESKWMFDLHMNNSEAWFAEFYKYIDDGLKCYESDFFTIAPLAVCIAAGLALGVLEER